MVMTLEGEVQRVKPFDGLGCGFGMANVGRDRIALTQYGANGIVILDVERLSIIKQLTTDPPLHGPCGIVSIANNTQLVVCENLGNRVRVMSVDGSFVSFLEAKETDMAPYAICTFPSAEDKVAVTDLVQKSLIIFSLTSGSALQVIKHPAFQCLCGVGSIGNDNVVVADHGTDTLMFVDLTATDIVRTLQLTSMSEGHKELHSTALCVIGAQIILCDEPKQTIHILE
jgi:hypothetical protein